MIKKILKLENVCNFSSISQEVDFKYAESENCNIVFGFNGTGKTTLSNAISLFSDTSYISEEEKSLLFEDITNEKNAAIELELQGIPSIKFNPTGRSHSKNIYVFNSSFTARHVFDGTKGRMRKFSNVSGELTNETIRKANDKIASLESDKKRCDSVTEQLDKKLETLTKTNSTNFNNTLTDKGKRLTKPNLDSVVMPIENIDDLRDKLIVLSSDYDLSKKQPELTADVAELELLLFNQINLDITKIDVILSKNIKQLSKEFLENKINETKSFFTDEDDIENVSKWFSFAKRILENGHKNGSTHCPVCDSDLSKRLDELLQDFNGYFDKSYEAYLKELNDCVIQVQSTIETIQESESSVKILAKLWERYKTTLPKLSFVSYDFSVIITKLNEIKKTCESKVGNIQLAQRVEQSSVELFNETINVIKGYDTLRNKMKESLESKKLNTRKIEDDIREVYGKIVLLEFDQDDKGGNYNKYIENKKEASIITTADSSDDKGLLFHQTARREEIRKVKVESKSILKYLKLMGIEHFTVDIAETSADENIVIRYNNSDADKNALRNSLSEGEKTSLAFAYFLSKFENERATNEERKDSVVIIDDPISSLDENRLYSTAYLIKDNFKSTKQLIVLSHNFLFLKFLSASYGGKPNCLFLKDEQIIQLPEEMQNFESPYFYMLKNVINYATDNTLFDYNHAKKYLPNYIRRVLETFLSFKFARIVNRAGSNRSPGLSEFDKNINDLDIEDAIKQDLNIKISKIARITDQHSHGNAQLTEENFFISETELVALAKNAVEIIDTLDNIHKIKAV